MAQSTPPDGTKPTRPRRLTVSCPTCREPTEYSTANRWRPFCSERCRMIDLGAWAEESYVVPGQPVEADDDLPPQR
ncbi:MAG: DNA gyrase inhibitor YacG [Lautropia sp.]|nr:DNA gyrase inhibitor YacG [Lautropia sp.]